MPNNIDLKGSSWAGLIVCPGNLSFAVTLSFNSMSGDEYSGSFKATGAQPVQGSFTATRTADTIAFRGSAPDWATLTCEATMAPVDGADQHALTGFVMTGAGSATVGVL